MSLTGVDYMFSAAALKQGPSFEFFPVEAVQTNILGTENMLLSAIEHSVKNVVVLSTDKATYPINGDEHTEGQEELANIYSVTDVYFNASTQETFGLTTI